MTDSASGIVINNDTAALINNALENGTPMLLAYVDQNMAIARHLLIFGDIDLLDPRFRFVDQSQETRVVRLVGGAHEILLMRAPAPASFASIFS